MARNRKEGRNNIDEQNNSRSFSGQGGQKEGSNDREGTGYTPESETEESDS